MPRGYISTSRDFNTQPAARRKRSKTLWTLLVLAVVSSVVTVVLVIALATLIVFTPSEEAATSVERGLVVDIRAVAAQIDDYAPDASRETILRHRYLDGSFDIDYTYRRADQDGLYVNCTLSLEPTVAQAETLARRLWGLKSQQRELFGGREVQLVERNDIYRWSDQSRLGVIMSAGRPAGNLFVARRGRAVFCLLLAGACFQQAEAFSSLVSPALARVKRYAP